MNTKKIAKLIATHLPDTEPLSAEEDLAVDLNLGLRPVTLRLQEDLISKLKSAARNRGLRYQVYIRFLLTEHIGTLGLASESSGARNLDKRDKPRTAFKQAAR